MAALAKVNFQKMDLRSSETPARPMSVSQLTFLIKSGLEASFPSVCVIGEISNFRRQSSGHCYFTLKDSSALINAVLFRGNALRVPFVLQDGLSVVVGGEISVYEARGQYQLVARNIQHAGLGSLQARFEALKKKLLLEGLFDAGKKRLLPKHPQSVVVITSLAAAALRDFLQVLQRRAPQISVNIVPVPVQGDESAPAITRALENINRWIAAGMINAEVVAIVRGGGSLEDLWAFNDENVARAIARCVLPTVTGVGHETDVTIADLAADVRAPTPSAAAELICANHAELVEKIDVLNKRMIFTVRSRISNIRLTVERLAATPVLRNPYKIFEQASQKIDDLAAALLRSTNNSLHQKDQALEMLSHRFALHHPSNRLRQEYQKIDNLADRLSLLNPNNVLKLGYAWVKNSAGKLLRSPREVAHGETINITLRDGTLSASVIKGQSPPENTGV